MKTWIRSSMAGRVGPYFQFCIPLVLLTALLFGLMATTGCGSCSNLTSSDAHKSPGTEPSLQCGITGDGEKTSGEKTWRTLGRVWQTVPGPSHVTYKYTPPKGVTSFEWGDRPPDNPNGPPPYVFSNMPTDERIDFHMTLPPVPSGVWSETSTEVLESENGDGTWSLSSMRTKVQRSPTRSTAEAPSAAAPARERQARGAEPLWEVGHWVDGKTTLTTEECDDWLAVLQSDSGFLAARVPIVPPAQPTQSYTIPLTVGGPNSATISLAQAGSPLLTLPLEPRPERFTFADNELPGAENEAYLALGVSQTPASCPAGLNLAPDDWYIYTNLWLDLRGQPNNCEGCALPFYYCYEGQELPAPLQGMAVSKSLARAAGVTSYQGEGITCLGPHFIRLTESAEWGLDMSSTGWFTPTAPITFQHGIWTDYSMSFTLEFSSTLGDVWGVYEGDWQGPTQPLVELAGPIEVEYWRYIWVIGHPAAPPAGGHYTLLITATREGAPAEQSVTSDLFWIDEWAPPPPPDEGPDFVVYLPLVQRVYAPSR